MERPFPSEPDLFTFEQSTTITVSPLVPMDPCERLQADFDGQNLTTGPHAMALLRPHLPEGVWRATDLVHAKNGERV